MNKVPTKQVVREDGLIELPIVLDFNFGDFDKVVGYAALDPDLLPAGAEYCLSLAYVKHDDGQIEVTGLSVVEDDNYLGYLLDRAAEQI